MAPFGKRKSQGWHSNGIQETSGRSSDHRSGRSKVVKDRTKSSFNTIGFKTTVNIHSAQPYDDSLNEIDQPMKAEDSSITEVDSEVEDVQTRPYNVLLQSLAEGSQPKQPPHKKRKINPPVERSDVAAADEKEGSEVSEASDSLDFDEKEVYEGRFLKLLTNFDLYRQVVTHS